MLASRSNEIEFIEETHTYLISGIVVPSVTQLLKKKFPDKYSDIPKSILENKAQFGNRIHEFIELDSRGETPALASYSVYERLCCEQWLKLRRKHGINPLENEMLIHYKDKYCGRLDMIAIVDGLKCLCDVKTTSKLDADYLMWQLGLYFYALKDMGYKCDFDSFKCIWLRKKELGEIVEIPKLSREEFEKFLEVYCDE